MHRDASNQNLMIVTGGKGVSARNDLPGIDILIRDGLSQLQVVVQSDDYTVQEELERALASLGIQVMGASNLLMFGRIDTAPVDKKEGWYWARGSYELQLSDSGKVLAKQRWPIKVSATDKAMVEPRVRDEVNRNLPNYVYELLSTEAD